MLVEKLQRVAGGSLFGGTVCFYQQAPKSDQNALLDGTGMRVMIKRLEQGCFTWPRGVGEPDTLAFRVWAQIILVARSVGCE
jgi:hypothetical protein